MRHIFCIVLATVIAATSCSAEPSVQVLDGPAEQTPAVLAAVPTPTETWTVTAPVEASAPSLDQSTTEPADATLPLDTTQQSDEQQTLESTNEASTGSSADGGETAAPEEPAETTDAGSTTDPGVWLDPLAAAQSLNLGSKWTTLLDPALNESTPRPELNSDCAPINEKARITSINGSTGFWQLEGQDVFVLVAFRSFATVDEATAFFQLEARALAECQGQLIQIASDNSYKLSPIDLSPLGPFDSNLFGEYVRIQGGGESVRAWGQRHSMTASLAFDANGAQPTQAQLKTFGEVLRAVDDALLRQDQLVSG